MRPVMRGWIILQNGEPLLWTIRRTRPEAWEAWEQVTRPQDGWSYNVEAKPVRLLIERL